MNLEAQVTPKAANKLDELEEVHNIIDNNLNHLATGFEILEQPKKMVNLAATLTKITKAAEELPKKEEVYQLIVEHSFLFFMEQILKELENMGRLIAKANSKDKENMI